MRNNSESMHGTESLTNSRGSAHYNSILIFNMPLLSARLPQDIKTRIQESFWQEAKMITRAFLFCWDFACARNVTRSHDDFYGIIRIHFCGWYFEEALIFYKLIRICNVYDGGLKTTCKKNYISDFSYIRLNQNETFYIL